MGYALGRFGKSVQVLGPLVLISCSGRQSQRRGYLWPSRLQQTRPNHHPGQSFAILRIEWKAKSTRVLDSSSYWRHGTLEGQHGCGDDQWGGSGVERPSLP